MTTAVYVDSSALAKLVLLEPESAVLQAFLGGQPARASSVLGQVEVARAVRRRQLPAAERQLAAIWRGISWLPLSAAVVDLAGNAGPAELRSLDAIHLASALMLAEDLAGMVTYDARLAAAARELGVTVWAPK